MKFAIVGAGATGGFLGGHLERAGHEVTLIARGANLAALQSNGLTVRSGGEEFTTHPRCTDALGAVADAEVVFLTVKAHALAAIAPQVAAEVRRESVLVTAQNGIPWWYFLGSEGPLQGTHLESVDPGGVIAGSLPLSQVVGCVVYPATALVAPGVVEHVEGDRFSLGELDGSRSSRCGAIAAALSQSGLKGRVQTRLRAEIWLKLLGNATLNPVSALTRSTLATMLQDPRTTELLRSLMHEVARVAGALGVEMELDVDRRMAGAAQVGDHRTSMLQDLEAGRALEVDALLGAVVEVAALLRVPTPGLEQLYALTSLLGRSAMAG